MHRYVATPFPRFVPCVHLVVLAIRLSKDPSSSHPFFSFLRFQVPLALAVSKVPPATRSPSLNSIQSPSILYSHKLRDYHRFDQLFLLVALPLNRPTNRRNPDLHPTLRSQSCPWNSIPSSWAFDVGYSHAPTKLENVLTMTGPFDREVEERLSLRNPNTDPVAFKVRISRCRLMP